MDDAIKELYQHVLLEHYKHPLNYGELPEPTHVAEGDNPLCGDHITVYLKVENGVIQEIKFTGYGCAISKASASVMTEAIKGIAIQDAKNIAEIFYKIVKGEISPEDVALPEQAEELFAFSGVRDFPTRVKCATLAWHTLETALQQKEKYTEK